MGQWLELKPVMFQNSRTQRAVKLEALLMARTQCQTECIAMVMSGNECQLEGYLSHGKLATVVCCAEVLIQPSFFVSKSASPGECVTERTTETLHRLSASLKQFSSTCDVSCLVARDTDHEHKFSLTYLSCLL